ncbi:hypothetical protein A2U01_0066959, partial [Trifolium medium]|nr:hypothetical protein [Trifolium medium]
MKAVIYNSPQHDDDLGAIEVSSDTHRPPNQSNQTESNVRYRAILVQNMVMLNYGVVQKPPQT